MKLLRSALLPLCMFCTFRAFAETSLYDGVAAYVNDKVITVDTVMQELHTNFDLSAVPRAEQPARVRELFPVMRDLLIDRILIVGDYEASGAELPQDAVNRRVQEIIAREFRGDRALLQQTLKENRMTYAMWEKQIRENLIVQAMRYLQVGKKINVSPAAVRRYYEKHSGDFALGSAARVRSILITPDKGRAFADELVRQLDAGASFAELAKAHSADEKAAEGGDWGFVDPATTFAPVIAQAIGALKVGERSPVIEQAGYCTILLKEDVRPGRVRPLEEVWGEVYDALNAELGAERYKAWVDGLRANAFVRVVDVEL